MADATPPPPPGFVAAIRQFGATLAALLHTRLRLLGVEVETELTRLILGLVWGLATLFFAAVAIVFAAVLLLVTFWETHRYLVLGGFVVVSTALALFAGLRVRDLLARRIRLFEGSLRELAADRDRLAGRRE
jgi:uncharacterized membrane protein YqjE